MQTEIFKTNISKIDAAKSQLLEAINLFFEERDPVSIHTLLGASLGISGDLVTCKEAIRKNGLIMHKDTPWIKQEKLKEWRDAMRADQNFFKHADRDISKGVLEKEFDPDVNAFYIHEAIGTLKAIETEKDFWPPEFKIFYVWFLKEYPDLVNNEAKDSANTYSDIAIASKKDAKLFLDHLKKQR